MLVGKRNVAVSSKPCSGWPAPAPNGGSSQPSMGIGTASTKGLPAGATGVSGNCCISIAPTTRIWNTSSSTAPYHRQHRGPGPSLRRRSAPQKGGQAAQALARSRGGFSTKVHVSVDALGNPLRFILTGGQKHDITQAQGLIADHAGEYVIADKGYDSREFRQYILERGMRPVIPPRSNRKEPQAYDACLYRERHLVECFINKIKHYRRVFSRFEKLDARYLGFLHFTAALIWLR